uniref:Uncharacterized protein n=1 Tax=Anguilla anguilla TaxID=7936 RepID=A0A0E9QYS1_ANGAN
MKINEGTTY